MIQRIQTVYLVLGAALLGVFAGLVGSESAVAATDMAWLTPTAVVLAAVAALTCFASMLFYKDRQRQRKAILAAQVLTLVVAAAAVARLFLTGAQGTEGEVGRYLIALLPVVGYVAVRLARRGVDKDIALVRSMDRLR